VVSMGEMEIFLFLLVSGSTDMSEIEGSNSGSSSADTSTNSQHLSDLINSNSSIDLSLLEDSVDPLDTVIHRK